jgi:hypothetical protein
MDKTEEKKKRIKEYKRAEYIKNADKIKKRQKEYYYRKKAEQGKEPKKKKPELKIEFYSEEQKERFIVRFD